VKDVYHRVRPFLSFAHWQGRLVLWAAAAGVGIAAVGFAQLADAAQALFRRTVASGSFWPWIVTPLGLFLSLGSRDATSAGRKVVEFRKQYLRCASQ